jgi:hypothetical protein
LIPATGECKFWREKNGALFNALKIKMRTLNFDEIFFGEATIRATSSLNKATNGNG